jgi:hypothetical protein
MLDLLADARRLFADSLAWVDSASDVLVLILLGFAAMFALTFLDGAGRIFARWLWIGRRR